MILTVGMEASDSEFLEKTDEENELRPKITH